MALALKDWQVIVTSLVSDLDPDEVGMFADVLGHGASAAYDHETLTATFHVIAADPTSAHKQGRMLAATAAMFSIVSRPLIRWNAEVRDYEEDV